MYLRNVDVLMGYFARRCRDPQTVADLTSETFVRAVDGYGDYPELLALSGLALAMVAVAPVCTRRVARRHPKRRDGCQTT